MTSVRWIFRLLLLSLFFLPVVSEAQYTNQWIQFNQTYFKISVTESGLFRVTYDDLEAAGFPLGMADPRLLQLFHRGQEQAIFFKHDQIPADSKFDPAEYLEFYGRKNDGTRDAQLYKPASVQPHSFYNLYSDTAAYFLTWNSLPVQGKRMEIFDQVNSTSIPAETAQLSERLSVFTAEYSAGKILNGYIQQSFFDEGEGWTGTTICTVNSGCTGQQDFTLEQINNTVQAAGLPHLEVQVAGRDALQHQVEIYAGATQGSLRLITTLNFSQFETPVMTADLNWSDINADGRLVVRVKAIGVGGQRERVSVSYVRLTFPQNFDLTTTAEKNLTLQPNGGGKSFIEMTNAPVNTRLLDVTDPSNVITIGTRTAGIKLTAVVPNTQSPRKLLITSSTKAVSRIRKVSFRALSANANYIIVTHRSLMKPSQGYSNPVQAYAGYRSSPEGGAYDTLVVTMDQLYNQFNYGETSPLGIYELMKYMTGEGNPLYLFLIGKGREVSAGFYRKTTLAPGEFRDLVPASGFPASDMAFTAGLGAGEFVPAVPTGRLTASTPEEVASYLNKVREAESIPFTELWRKKILHLSGGIYSAELPLFKGYMLGFGDIARGKFLGGNVITFGKHSGSAVEFINISKEINDGLNLVTFFGHSSSTATDIDIGRVSEPLLGFNNKGKYPAFLVNGCNAGEFFNNSTNFGEDWILTANKGARNFIANSSFGFDGILRYYTTLFYEVAFADSAFLNSGIGNVQKEVARRMMTATGSDPSIYSAQVQQMVLLGDPSLRLFAPTLPDFETNDASILVNAFDGKPIHALTDSIQVGVIVKNLGRGVSLPLRVELKHTIGDVVVEYDSLFKSPLFQDTLRFTLRRGTGNFFGTNQLTVALDPDDDFPELREDNNQASWSKQISFNGTMNLHPFDFAVVSSTDVDFIFQDTDLLASQKTYLLELDTVPDFSSTYLQRRTINARVLARQLVTLLQKDSTVYFWRTKIAGEPDDQWETTSFTYITGSDEGWAQIKMDQFIENDVKGLVPNEGRFDFEETSVSVFVKNFGSDNPTPTINGSFQVNNAEYYFSPQGFNCRTNTINLVAFDRSTVIPYLAVPFTFQNSASRSCGREPMLINSFTSAEVDTGNQDDLIQYINNVKVSDSVVLFTMGLVDFGSWSANTKTKLGELGINTSDLEVLEPGEPIIILARKGAEAGSAKILRSDQPFPAAQELQLNDDLTGRISNGTIKSLTIGPAVAWKSISSKVKKEASDEVDLELYGVARDGRETYLFAISEEQTDLSFIDADEFPFLRLHYRVSDELQLTPSQLKHWIVSYVAPPDGLTIAADPTPVVVAEGGTWKRDFGFVNISDRPFLDSLQVTVDIVNRETRSSTRQEWSIKGPAAGDTTHFTIQSSTLNNAGSNDLTVFVNRNIVPEQYYQNNAMDLVDYLQITRDRYNPVLDVTMDGRYVTNGDFVSPNPLVLIRVLDENPFLIQSDTSGLSVLMSYPCSQDECTPRRINFSDPQVSWSFPASGNELRVEFKPENLEEGEYVLYVIASDVSGNPSGENPYTVSFVVEKDQRVRFLPPYPNPSSNGFFFGIQISGNVQPDEFQLQVYNRDGRNIGDYTEADAPRLIIGSNTIKWNGTDESGNPLSPGIYLYRLTIRNGEQNFLSSGKLMIIR